MTTLDTVVGTNRIYEIVDKGLDAKGEPRFVVNWTSMHKAGETGVLGGFFASQTVARELVDWFCAEPWKGAAE